jgi:hypothetical protein
MRVSTSSLKLLAMGLVVLFGTNSITQAANLAESLKPGKVTLKSAGPLAFGPEGILFLGDPQAGTIYAIATNDAKAEKAAPIEVEKLDQKLAGLLGVKAEDVKINDIAVNPASKQLYLSVSRGKNFDAIPVLLKISSKGEINEVSLENVPFSKTEISNPAGKGAKRQEAITDLKFVKGKLYVAGLSNEEFASTLRSIAFPFDGNSVSAGIQIYHGAHGKYETAAPVRTFASVEIGGKEEILAAYTCTPLVRIPVEQLQDKAKVKGTTVAELGNRNRPLDIVIYQKDGKQFALMANSARGVMKVDLEAIDKVEAIAARVADTAGLKYEKIAIEGVEQLDRLGDKHAVLISRSKTSLDVKTIELP